MNTLAEQVRTRKTERFYLAWRVIRPTVGLLLVGLGSVGMIVPIAPGLPLLVAGAVLVAPNHRVVRSAREKMKTWRPQCKLFALVLVMSGVFGAVSAVPVHAEVDDVLRERIEEQARQEKRLAGTLVVVRVQSRDVLLSGTVRLYVQKMTYENIAWHTQGIRDVENEIRVAPVHAASDEEIRQVITRLLVEEERLHGLQLGISVKRGRVSLSGTFHGPAEVLELKRQVGTIEGVLDIEIDAKILA